MSKWNKKTKIIDEKKSRKLPFVLEWAVQWFVQRLSNDYTIGVYTKLVLLDIYI